VTGTFQEIIDRGCLWAVLIASKREAELDVGQAAHVVHDERVSPGLEQRHENDPGFPRRGNKTLDLVETNLVYEDASQQVGDDLVLD
jgi:hypothetical protein